MTLKDIYFNFEIRKLAINESVTSYLYLRTSSGCVIAGGFHANCSQVAEWLSTANKCGGDEEPWTGVPVQPSDETFKVTIEYGRDVPFSLRDTTKNLYFLPVSRFGIFTIGTVVLICWNNNKIIKSENKLSGRLSSPGHFQIQLSRWNFLRQFYNKPQNEPC